MTMPGKSLSAIRRSWAVCPTIRGTRITAQSILGRLESGDSVESVLEDYPYLDRDAVEAAALYAKANPPRGRPGGKLWRSTS